MSGPLRTALERSLSVVVPWLAVGVMRLGAGTTLARAQMGFIPARSRRDTINALGVAGPARPSATKRTGPPGPYLAETTRAAGDLRQAKVALATVTPVELTSVARRIWLAWTSTVWAQSPVPW
jgi:hypothetical protein